MTNLVYYSQGVTGYTNTFINRLELPAVRLPELIKDAKDFRISEPFVLVCPTYESERAHGIGRTLLPRQVASFLNIPENRELMRAVVGTGNRNFYADFAGSAVEINKKTGVPILHQIELAGTDREVFETRNRIEEFWLTQRSAPQVTLI